jgi:hypothetical protein
MTFEKQIIDTVDEESCPRAPYTVHQLVLSSDGSCTGPAIAGLDILGISIGLGWSEQSTP